MLSYQPDDVLFRLRQPLLLFDARVGIRRAVGVVGRWLGRHTIVVVVVDDSVSIVGD